MEKNSSFLFDFYFFTNVYALESTDNIIATSQYISENNETIRYGRLKSQKENGKYLVAIYDIQKNKDEITEFTVNIDTKENIGYTFAYTIYNKSGTKQIKAVDMRTMAAYNYNKKPISEYFLYNDALLITQSEKNRGALNALQDMGDNYKKENVKREERKIQQGNLNSHITINALDKKSIFFKNKRITQNEYNIEVITVIILLSFIGFILYKIGKPLYKLINSYLNETKEKYNKKHEVKVMIHDRRRIRKIKKRQINININDILRMSKSVHVRM